MYPKHRKIDRQPTPEFDCFTPKKEAHVTACKDCAETSCNFTRSNVIGVFKCFVTAPVSKKTVIGEAYSIDELAHLEIYKCKEAAYGAGTDASNEMEGDFGTWDEWEDVLCNFAVFVLENYKEPK
jgi:hypothetical protein